MRWPTQLRILRSCLYWLAAVLVLQIAWMMACERWRDGAPMLLISFVAAPWTVFVAAWVGRSFDSVVRRGAALATALVLLDIAIDASNPYPPRFAVLGWELLRVGAVFLAVAVVRRPFMTKRSVRVGMRLAQGISSAMAALVPLTMGYIAYSGSRDQSAKADVALVLGAHLDEHGNAPPRLVGRVERATELVRDGLVPKLIMSGGGTVNGVTEAAVMRKLAIARGTPEEAIVLDERARSTIENFACSIPVLEALGAHRVLVVTEPWHMTRAMLLARRHGLDARAAPASSETWRSPRHASYWLFRDSIAYLDEALRSPWAKPGQCGSPACEGCRKNALLPGALPQTPPRYEHSKRALAPLRGAGPPG